MPKTNLKFKDLFATSRYNQSVGPDGYYLYDTLVWCVSEPNKCGATVKLYHLYNDNNNQFNDHMLTSDENERCLMVKFHGYVDHGGEFILSIKVL